MTREEAQQKFGRRRPWHDAPEREGRQSRLLRMRGSWHNIVDWNGGRVGIASGLGMQRASTTILQSPVPEHCGGRAAVPDRCGAPIIS